MAGRSSDRKSTAQERLRANVGKAIEEIARLRRENASLEKRIQKLQQRPEVAPDATVLTFDERPEVVRRRVEQLIESIDQRLVNADLPNAGNAPSTNGS